MDFARKNVAIDQVKKPIYAAVRRGRGCATTAAPMSASLLVSEDGDNVVIVGEDSDRPASRSSASTPSDPMELSRSFRNVRRYCDEEPVV